jgi:hypothetical protein
MKKVLLIAVVFSAVFTFVSCKKCVTCSYEYEYLGGKKEVTFPQECGTSKQIKTYKDNSESDANLHGVNSTCTNN